MEEHPGVEGVAVSVAEGQCILAPQATRKDEAADPEPDTAADVPLLLSITKVKRNARNGKPAAGYLLQGKTCEKAVTRYFIGLSELIDPHFDNILEALKEQIESVNITTRREVEKTLQCMLAPGVDIS